MFWADQIASKIIQTRSEKKHHVDDMKTPSGRVHVGSLRGVMIHDFVARALLEKGVQTIYTYVFNDLDPMDGLPSYLDAKKFGPYMGKPLGHIPSPDGKAKSFARYYSEEFIKTMGQLGVFPEIVYSSQLYQSGKMNEVVQIALDHAVEIRQVYQEVAGYQRDSNWYPLQVICPDCGKVGTTMVTGWDGKVVTFECRSDLVEWAKGCGMSGKISPFDGRAKLLWKVDWPAHWKVLGVTVEGAGKDHSSAGGSRDIARALLQKVFNYPNPFDIPYEWFLIGGRKMSSSKGVGMSASEFVQILPSVLGRFLFARNHYNKQINFNPEGDTIPDLFDEFDRCGQIYWEKGNLDDFGRVFEVSYIESAPKKHYLPRFRDVAQVLQMPGRNVEAHFTKDKGGALTDYELKVLLERVNFAKLWLERFASKESVSVVQVDLPTKVHELSKIQKEFLKLASQKLTNTGQNELELQNQLFELIKAVGLSGKEAFAAIYQALLGKSQGPKAAQLILSLERAFVLERFLQSSLAMHSDTSSNESSGRLANIHDPKLMQISASLWEEFPSLTVGLAIIRGVRVLPKSAELEKLKKEMLAPIAQLSLEGLEESPSVQSFRKVYEAMGVNWKQRRPSPEALMRRVILGKGFPCVNTCVDAYNLVVVKTGVSIGAFDYAAVDFPTNLQQAQGGEAVNVVGEKKPVILKSGEFYYGDKQGPYNIDLNYRDAVRTAVTEQTADLWINAEGIFDIKREQVEKALERSVELIVRFCGGTVEKIGIVQK